MTHEQIDALTMADVDAAQARRIEARKTRAGITTIDFILGQVGPKRSLDEAKQYLHTILKGKDQ